MTLHVLRTARAVACAVLVCPLTAPVVLAQNSEAATEVPFFEAVDVDVAEVEVVVLDRKGRPVDDLERDDFQLLIDGREREIVGFAVHTAGDIEASRGRRSAPAAPDVQQRLPGTLPGGEDALSLVIYVDDANLRPGGRKRVLEEVSAALDPDTGLATGTSDRFLVVSADRGLDLMDGWTTDRDVVRQRVAELLGGAPSGIHVTRARLGVLQALEDEVRLIRERAFGATDPCENTNLRGLKNIVSQHAVEVEHDARVSLGTFSDLISAMAGVPGRKVVLNVSDGFSQRPGVELFQFLIRFCPIHTQYLTSEYLKHDLTQEIQSFDLHAAGNGVTIYSLETDNARSDGAMSASGEFRFDNLESRMAEANTRSTLAMMASETGGRLIVAAADLSRELERVGDELETYYSLAYRPDPDAPPGERWIKVEVEGRGLRVLHRQVTRDKEAAERLAERVYGAILFGFEDNPMDARLEVADPTPEVETRLAADAPRGERAPVTVPVEIRVPIAALGLVPGEDASLGRLLLVMTARDGEGRWQPIKRQKVPVVVPHPQHPQEGEPDLSGLHLIRVDMELQPGTQEIAVGLRDEIEGTTAYLRRDFEIPATR